MSSLAPFNKSCFTGFHDVRNFLLDYCNEEQASRIIGRLYNKCVSLEKECQIRCITEFELQYLFLDNQVECIDVHYMKSRGGQSVGSCRLYYRDNTLTPYTELQEMETEMIPVSMCGRKMKDITPIRMKMLIRNSKVLICDEVQDLANSIVDAFMRSSQNNNVLFQIDIHRRFINMSALIDNEKTIRVSLPLAWFAKKVKPLVTEDVNNEGYIFEPTC